MHLHICTVCVYASRADCIFNPSIHTNHFIKHYFSLELTNVYMVKDPVSTLYETHQRSFPHSGRSGHQSGLQSAGKMVQLEKEYERLKKGTPKYCDVIVQLDCSHR